MIDFVKIQINSGELAGRLASGEGIKTQSVSDEVLSYSGKRYGMDLSIRGTKVILSGSLHKLWNGYDFNGNDFPLWAIEQTIEDLCLKFGFDAVEAVIMGLEYGVNIHPFESVKEILQSTVVYDYRKPFVHMKNIKGVGNGKEANRSNYRIKIYDKGLQYGLSNTLRFEVKTLRDEDLQGTGANVLADLLNARVLDCLHVKLLERFNNVLLLEKVGDWSLSEKQRLFLKDAANPNYWSELRPWQRHDRKAKYHKLIEDHGQSQTKKDLYRLIDEKWGQLQKCNVFTWFTQRLAAEKCNVFTWFDEPEISEDERQKCNVFTLLKVKNVTLGQFGNGQSLPNGFGLPSSSGRQGIFYDAAGSKSLPYGLELSPVGKYGITTKLLRKIAGKCPDCVDGYDTRKEKRKRKRDHVDETELIAHALRNAASNGRNNARKSWERKRAKCGGAFLFSEEECVSPYNRALLSEFRGTQWDCGF